MRTNHWTLRLAMRRTVEIWRESGPRVLFWKVLGETVFRRLRYLELSLSDTIAPASPMAGVIFAELSPDRWRELQWFRPGTGPEEITSRLQRGHRCFIASAQGRIVYAGWIASELAWCEALGVEIPLARNSVYFYESYTLPEMRGGGLAPGAANFYLRLLRQAGVQSVVAVVDAENQSGLRALEKSGYHSAGWLAVLRLGPWRKSIRWSGPRTSSDAPSSADSA